MSAINKVCLIICILCILGATTLSIMGIWKMMDDKEVLWRSVATLGVIFFGSLLTVIVHRIIPGR